MDLDLLQMKKGDYLTIPQIGNVIVKDNVSIGSNTVIDRATLKIYNN